MVFTELAPIAAADACSTARASCAEATGTASATSAANSNVLRAMCPLLVDETDREVKLAFGQPLESVLEYRFRVRRKLCGSEPGRLLRSEDIGRNTRLRACD